MADHVRRDLPPGERGHTGRTTLDKPVDPEPCIRSLLPAEEDGIAGCPLLHQFGEDTFGPRPEWTLAVLSALAVDGHEWMTTVAAPDLQIPRHQVRRFGDARAAIVEEQQQGMFHPAPWSATVGDFKQGLHLRFAEPADRLRRGLLHGNRADIAAPLQVAGIATGDEACEGANRSQALIAGLHGAAAVFLDMGEELQHAPGREVVHRKPVDRLAGLGAHERQQESEGVPIALLRVPGEVALGDNVFGQEAPQPGAECTRITHGRLR